jgi:ABC-type uncharacterized transport system permease subunit
MAAMTASFLMSISALAALVPAAIAPVARPANALPRDSLYWLLLAIACVGPAAWVAVEQASSWRTGVAAALWLSIAVSVILFAIVAALMPVARRLTPLLLGYLFCLGLVATIWLHAPERPLSGLAPDGWLQAHILVAIVAYGLVTLAAVAGVGVALQERALRAKRTNSFTRHLPSIADGEALQVKLLAAGEIVLAVALVTGMALGWSERGQILRADHKTILSVATFIVIAVLLIAHHRGGLSGRRIARFGLVAYLLLTLAYPGVKFVTDVLLG